MSRLIYVCSTLCTSWFVIAWNFHPMNWRRLPDLLQHNSWWSSRHFFHWLYYARLITLPRKESHLLSFHDDCRHLFVTHLRAQQVVAGPWCWGAGSFDLTSALTTLLTQHGVPSTAADSRAKLFLQSLWRVEVERAIQGSAQINSSKGSGKSKRPSGKGASGKGVVRPADLDPSKLVLEPGTNQPLLQIPLSQAGPLSTGFALDFECHYMEPQTSLHWSSIRCQVCFESWTYVAHWFPRPARQRTRVPTSWLPLSRLTLPVLGSLWIKTNKMDAGKTFKPSLSGHAFISWSLSRPAPGILTRMM